MRDAQIPRILVVDDEKDVRERIRSFILRKINCEVEIAPDGKVALEKLKQIRFDLVLLDIKMPGLSGIDVIKEAVKFTPQTKIIAFSGYDSQEVADLALKEGAVDFLPKPHTIEAIELKVKNVLTQIGKYQPR